MVVELRSGTGERAAEVRQVHAEANAPPQFEAAPPRPSEEARRDAAAKAAPFDNGWIWGHSYAQ